jgi:5-methylthioadenosine/S-adenosylhomocysteine deaminase
MQLVIKNARILANTATCEITEGDLVCEDGCLTGVGPDLAKGLSAGPERQFIDAAGKLAMPGLVNAHFHSTSAFMRGAVTGMPLEPYMMFEAPLDGFSHSPRLYYLRAMLSAIDMMRQGVVALRDDVHFFGDPTLNNADAILTAYRDSGLRASVGFGIPMEPERNKIPYLDDFLADRQRTELDAIRWPTRDEVLTFYDKVFAKWHGQEKGRLTIHTSCSTPHRVDADMLRALSDLARHHNVSFDTHLLETKTQAVHEMNRSGGSLVQYLRDQGVLDDHLVAIHSVWLDDDDLDLLAASGAVVAHNPVSNLKLGSGVMPMIPMRSRNIPIALGTDEAAVDDGNNLWINAKLGMLLQNITGTDSQHWPGPQPLLEAMTHGGARAMRRDKAGTLAPGMEADIILLDLDHALHLPRNNIAQHLVGAETGSSVTHTIVAGEVMMEDGRLTRIDEAAILEEIKAIWARYAALRDQANADVADLVPAYRKAANKALEQPWSFSRHVTGKMGNN